MAITQQKWPVGCRIHANFQGKWEWGTYALDQCAIRKKLKNVKHRDSRKQARRHNLIMTRHVSDDIISKNAHLEKKH